MRLSPTTTRTGGVQLKFINVITAFPLLMCSVLPPIVPPRWVIVYPAYLNAKKTLVQGRRLSKAKAVDNPLCSEIRDVCTSLELPVDIEPKHYPRELARDPIHSGRVRVQIKNDDGTPCNETISNSTSPQLQ